MRTEDPSQEAQAAAYVAMVFLNFLGDIFSLASTYFSFGWDIFHFPPIPAIHL